MTNNTYSLSTGNPVYTTIGTDGRTAYHKSHSIEGIVYESPSTQRIKFRNGEIVLRVSGNELNVYSMSYSTGRAKITQRVVKKLIKGYDATSVLSQARSSIVQRVINLEMNELLEQKKQEVSSYMDNYHEELRKKREAATQKVVQFDKSLDLKKVAEAFLKARSAA